MLRITYDAHNGYPYVPIGRTLIERKLIPRKEMSLERIGEWMRANPRSAEEVRRQNRSFVFFRIAGLSDEGEAFGAQGVPLTPGRSIAVDNSTHVYGTPFFIQTGLPLTNEKRTVSFKRLMIAQDTGSAIVGPARADIYWGAGDQAGRVAGRLRHPGKFVMLVPREVDPVAAGERMPLPPEKPPPAAKASVKTLSSKASHPVYPRWYRPKRPTTDWMPVRSRWALIPAGISRNAAVLRGKETIDVRLGNLWQHRSCCGTDDCDADRRWLSLLAHHRWLVGPVQLRYRLPLQFRVWPDIRILRGRADWLIRDGNYGDLKFTKDLAVVLISHWVSNVMEKNREFGFLIDDRANSAECTALYRA
jgi:3D (Asp-Asp-Asp) domain-containing protein